MSVTESNEPKVEELERQVDASRAQVSHTLDELQSHVSETLDEWRSKLTAEEITRELKSYAAGYVSNLGHRISTNVRENPASALAIGAAAAWPVYRVAKKIPLSVYLMGAGVALMKPIGRAWEHGREAFTDLTPPSRPRSDRYARVAGDSDAGSSGTMADATGRAGEAMSDVASGVRNAAHQAYEAAAELASDLPERASALSRQARSNPLLLGAIGLAASAAIAAAFPARQRPPARRRNIPRDHALVPVAPVEGARAAVLRAYGVARREALAAGASVTEADRIARSFIMRMGGRGNEAPAGYEHGMHDVRRRAPAFTADRPDFR